MFYAQFVLAKKGPLSKIWLAAHWEKKLTKSQIFETDVPLAIEEVMQPKVKMALRTVGHLLLGIVRIYSKKTRYLLADTNEAFLKMRLNFRNGFQIEIDDILAEDEGENMDMYDEVNMTIPEFMDVDLDERALQANLSRLEDITLKDDRDLNSVFSNLKCVELDNFGGQRIDDFGEFEQIYGSFPASSIQTPDGSVHRQDFSAIQEVRNADHTSEQIDRLRDDTVLLNSTAGQDNAEKGFEDPRDDSIRAHSLFELKPHIAGDGDLFNSMVDDVPQEAPGDEFLHVHDGDMYGAMGDFGSPPAENQDAGNRGSFSLEPLNMSHIEGKKGRKNKRTRNLLVDDNTTIPNDLIKNQMEDFSDILTTITMAPPSKKMLKMCITGDLNHLMNEPATNMGNRELKAIYRSHLVPTAYKPDLTVDQEEGSSSDRRSQPWDDLELVDNIADDVSVELGENRPDSRVNDFIQDDIPMGDDFYPPAEPFQNRTLECVEEAQRSGIIPTNVDEFGGFGFNPAENKENREEEDYSDPFSSSSNSSRGRLEAYGFGSAVKKAIYEDGKWEKRSKQILKKISSEMESCGVVPFSSIVNNAKNRKQAAEQFYSLLTLAKSQAISVDQPEPFGEILIRSGECLADHMENINKSASVSTRTPLRAM